MGGGGASVSNCFAKHPNQKKNFFLGGGGIGECVGVGRGVDGRTNVGSVWVWGEGWMDGQTNRPKPICPFNFFEVGGITKNKCMSYGPDKLNLRPFYHLTLKCDLDLQLT